MMTITLNTGKVYQVRTEAELLALCAAQPAATGAAAGAQVTAARPSTGSSRS